MNARELLAPLIGRTITTITGRPNIVVAIAESEVIVATTRSPAGTSIPIQSLQDALDRLEADGEIEISVDALGFRSAFIGAALLTVPGVARLTGTPPRLRLSPQDPRTRIPTEAAALNAWWEGDARERYWLEITDRLDLGIDLHAPQRDTVIASLRGFAADFHVLFYTLDELEEEARDPYSFVSTVIAHGRVLHGVGSARRARSTRQSMPPAGIEPAHAA